MKKRTYWMFYIFLVLINSLIQIIIFAQKVSLKLFIASLLGGLIGIGLVFLYNKLRTTWHNVS